MRSRSMPPILWAIDEIYADTDFTEYRIQILVYSSWSEHIFLLRPVLF
jgi:hypothetical protein